MYDNAGNPIGYMTNDGSSGIWSIYDKAGNYQGRVNDGVIYNNKGDYIGQIK
jgi:YD repeat-containing protein